MRRREFITLLGGAAAAWPLAARGQQPATPVIGFLNNTSPETVADRLRAFRQGLKEAGFVEGENVAIEYRWAEGQYDRLPALAAELVRRQVAVIVATGGSPVALAAKRLGLLRELVPAAARVALLIDPATMDSILEDAKTAARTMGLQIQVVHASTSRDIEAAFASFGRERPDALLVGGGAFLFSRRIQLALLAARYAVPASYGSREYPEIGGLMSYGTSLTDAYRQVGVYAGRVLKGAKAADLPVLQA